MNPKTIAGYFITADNKNIKKIKMAQRIPTDLHGAQLAEWLEHNSDAQHDETYFRVFDQAELDDNRRQHAELSIKLEDRQKEHAEIKKEHAEICRTIRTDIAATLKSIRRRGIEEKGRCYIFKDYENLTVSTYTRFGVMINTRPMTPEERQLAIEDGATIRPLRAMNG